MQLNDLKTLTGLPLKDLAAKLDEQLPSDAYKAITGTHSKYGGELTDIDPNYMTQVLTACFGFVGVGYGFEYEAGDLTITTTGEKGMGAWIAYLTKGVFWYTLTDGKETMRFSVAHSGGSVNSRPDFAAKGALTSALAGAVSKIGFQKSVYLGARSHRTVGGSGGTKNAGSAARTETQPCPIHNVPMREYARKDGNGKYFAHKDGDKWCYGETKTK